MQKFELIPLSTDFNVKVDADLHQFDLTPSELRRIEQIWEQQKQTTGLLFNGKLFSFKSIKNNVLVGKFIEYKHYIAQKYDPSLKTRLQIETISISGITRAADKFLIGKRSNKVANYPNYYEFVPSGGVDPKAVVNGQIDIQKQFRREFCEETGFSVSDIKEIHPLFLLHDLTLGNYELCAELLLNDHLADILPLPNQEYQDFFWLSSQELPLFIAKYSQEFLPFSLLLLEKFKKNIYN